MRKYITALSLSAGLLVSVAGDKLELYIKNSLTNSTYNQRFEISADQAMTNLVVLL